MKHAMSMSSRGSAYSLVRVACRYGLGLRRYRLRGRAAARPYQESGAGLACSFHVLQNQVARI